MKLQEVKEIAKQRGIKTGNMKKADIIRTIQRDEGYTACFGSGQADTCSQNDCLWRGDCS
ncbi:MAG: hypothetical protein U0411_01535 [Thermodesulfovibrionales bacterium]